MLLTLFSRSTSTELADQITQLLSHNLGSRDGFMCVSSLSDENLAEATSSMIVLHERAATTTELRAALAAASGVLWVSTETQPELRQQLGIGAGGGAAVPLTVAIITDERLNIARAEQEMLASSVVQVSPELDSTKARQQIRRITRRVSRQAENQLQLEERDRASIRESAKESSTRRLEKLLERTDAEEITISAGRPTMLRLANGQREQIDAEFHTTADLVAAIKHLAANADAAKSETFSYLKPSLDMPIKGGWRLHATSFVVDPAFVCLRSNKGAEVELAGLDLATDDLNQLLATAVAGEDSSRLNMVVAASMSGGKTTLMQALLRKVPDHERIDTIEDTLELRLHEYGLHANTYERSTRNANAEGIGAYGMADHVRDAKRCHTDKLVIGETRGEGSLEMLNALSSGLQGCLVSIHAPSGDGILQKLISYCTFEGASEEHSSREIANAVQLVVALGFDDGKRRIINVTQLVGYDSKAGQFKTRLLWDKPLYQTYAQPIEPPEPGSIVEDTYIAAGLEHLIDQDSAALRKTDLTSPLPAD